MKTGTSLAQGGSGFPFFAKCVFDYICGKDVNDIEVEIDAIYNFEVHDLLTKVYVPHPYLTILYTIDK